MCGTVKKAQPITLAPPRQLPLAVINTETISGPG